MKCPIIFLAQRWDKNRKGDKKTKPKKDTGQSETPAVVQNKERKNTKQKI